MDSSRNNRAVLRDIRYPFLALIVAAMLMLDPRSAIAQEAIFATASGGLALDLSQAVADAAAGAPDANAGPQTGSEKWWARLDLALWLPGISGTIGAAGSAVSVSESFADVARSADALFGFGGALAVGKGKAGGYVDGYWSRIGAAVASPGGTVNVVSEMGIFDFGVSYEVLRRPMEWTAAGDKPARDLVVIAYGGGRYTNVNSTLTLAGSPSVKGDRRWVDPMIGARGEFPLGQHFSLAFRGDIGGFGASSDLAWTAAGAISWDFYLRDFPASLQMGYLAIGDNYHTGTGGARFTWNTILHGLILNFSMQF